MVETAALLVDHVLPHRPVRQWVLSFSYPLRFLLASQAHMRWARYWPSLTVRSQLHDQQGGLAYRDGTTHVLFERAALRRTVGTERA